jgi:hypothetical protein
MPRPSAFDPELAFPVRDEASARLMSFKADCLFQADIITDEERQCVRDKAAATLEQLAA